MHKHIIKHMSDEAVRDYLTDIISMLRSTDYDLYEKIEHDLYKSVYGCHFTDWLLEEAVNKMVNEDGSTGPHWKLNQTNQVAKSLGVDFSRYNEYDFNYVMNMLYSDFYGAVSNNIDTFGRMAIKFLDDKDACEGKALAYYCAMK